MASLVLKQYAARSAGTILLRLAHGADLLKALQEVVAAENIRCGQITFIGAVLKGALAYYDQAAQRYNTIALDEPLEIAGGLGNISLKDGQPFVHAHVSFADSQGRLYGGHLAEGTLVFAAEVCIEVLEAPQPPARRFDAGTGLYLW